MTYQELETVPAYEIARWEDGKVVNAPDAIKWGRKDGLPPPATGSRIIVLINNCGPAIVTGYFVEHGWLGLRCRLTNPPEWHVRQNNGNPNGHVFGPEFRLPTNDRTEGEEQA